MFNLGTAVAYLALNATQVQQGVQAATAALGQLQSNVGRFGKDTANVYKSNYFALRDLATGYTAIAGAAASGFGVAIKSAISWESALADIERTTSDSSLSAKENKANIDALGKALLQLAGRKPIPSTDIAKIAADAGALGIRGTDNIVKFTSVVADLGATTNLTEEQASSALARIGNIMDRTNPQYERMASTTLELGRQTAATEDESVSMAKRIAGAGKQVGLSTDQVLSYAAALASVGVREEQGGSAISRTFIDINDALSKGGDDLKNFATVSGKTTQQFRKDFRTNAGQATADFIEGLGRMKDGGQDVLTVLGDLGITEVRQRDAILRLADSQGSLSDTLKIGAQAWAANTALAEIAGKRYETTGAQLQMLKNNFFGLAATIGGSFLGPIKLAVSVLQDLTTGLQEIPGPMRTVLVAGVALIGVVAALSAGFVFFLPRIRAIQAALAELAAEAPATAAALGTLNTALGAIGVVLAIGIGLVTLFGHSQRNAAKESEEFAKQQDNINNAVQQAMAGNTQILKQIVALILYTGALGQAFKAAHITAIELFNAVNIGSTDKDLQGLIGRINDYGKESRKSGQDTKKVKKATDEMTDAVVELRSRIGQAAAAENDQRDAMKSAGVAINDNTAAVEKNTKAVDDAIERADRMNNAQLALISATMQARQAQFALTDAQEKAADAEYKLAHATEYIQQAEDRVTTARINQEKAADTLAEAERKLAHARQEAADAVIDAELDLLDAEDKLSENREKQIDLQKALNDAMEGPTVDDLRKATDALSSAMLRLQHAQQGVEDAQWQLNYLMEEGASARDLKDAQLALLDAQQEVKDSINDQTDAQKELDDLTDPVKRAKAIADAQRDYNQSVRDGIRDQQDIMKAEQALAQARDDAANDKAYKDALYDVKSAQIAVRDSNLEVQEQTRALQQLQNGQIERQYRQAQLDLEDAYYRVATANVEVQKQQILAKGGIYDSRDAVIALKNELIALGQTAVGPVAADLVSFGGTLDAVTVPRKADINVGVNGVGPAEAALNEVGDTADSVTEDTRSSFQKMFDWILQHAGPWADKMKGILKPIGQFMGKVVGAVSSGGNIGGGHDTPFVPWAKGGLVTKAHLGLVGEAGPELILPLRDMNRTWQLLKDSGLLNQMMSSLTGGMAGSDISRFVNSFSGSMLGGGQITNNKNVAGDQNSLNFITQADPAKFANAMAWRNRVRRR